MIDAVARAHSSLEKVSTKSERGESILAQQFLCHRLTKGELKALAVLNERSVQIFNTSNFRVHKYGVEGRFAIVNAFTGSVETVLKSQLLRREGLARSS